ncbi:Uncharacterised protein [uncultured archaeon]|nr:Uncharacterised protein [uncultured archaeon]
MIYITLTGMARHVIKELLAARVRTVEIRSPNNFFALLSVQPGDKIFLTDSSAPDVVPGTGGIITSIRALQTITHRTVQSSEDFFEEREAQAARVQLQLVAMGRVRRVASIEPNSPLMLDVDEVKYCDAR